MKALIAVVFAVLSTQVTFSNPGDTLRVTAHRDVTITTNPAVGYTRYPVWASFPSTAFKAQRVLAYLTFECAPGMMCGEWDYLNFIHIGQRNGLTGDTLDWEIARFITPYGKYWHSDMAWKHGWYMDVTEFSGQLRDSVEIIYEHTGYEGTDRGWKINLEFLFVEGDPAREILSIEPLWKGSFPYGNNADPIENYLKPKTINIGSDSRSAELYIVQTGHGMDATQNCAEFCSKLRLVKFDGANVVEQAVWRNDCGDNSLYPQAGTWLYDRANWCPGSPVYPVRVNLPFEEPGEHTVDINMTPYSGAGGANYVFSTYLIQYADKPHALDVALVDVIAPSDKYEHKRLNPICGNPVVQIKNTGKNATSSVEFKYGIEGSSQMTYKQTIRVFPNQTATVTLPGTFDPAITNGTFKVEIVKVNDAADGNAVNNTATSKFTRTGALPVTFDIEFKTNNAPGENSWIFKNLNTNLEITKSAFAPNTVHRQNINTGTGCVQFQILDTGSPPANNPLNEDGLSWWANTADGEGKLVFKQQATETVIKDFTPTYTSNGHTLNGGDFGSRLLYQYRADPTVGQQRAGLNVASVQVYPNPNRGTFTLDIFTSDPSVKVEIADITGKIVFSTTQNLIDGHLKEMVRLDNPKAGVYVLRVISDSSSGFQKIVVN